MNEPMRINPNPRIVSLLDYALGEIVAKLAWDKDRYEKEWFVWAAEWKDGRRSPGRCVDVAHKCFAHKGWGIDGKATDPVHHTLGQLAWGGKEACYSTPTSGWLVIRYIADAMTAFGIAFPDHALPALDPPPLAAAARIASCSQALTEGIFPTPQRTAAAPGRLSRSISASSSLILARRRYSSANS